jgi:hypothetical protein
LKKLKQVRPEDFDVEALLAAAREGRLYVDENKKEISWDVIIKEVRTYVGRIETLVTKEFSSSIDDLWEQILTTEDFQVLLTPSCKARKCKEFNKYGVMRIIGVLREKGVYGYYNDSKYNALLEQTDKDTPYRKYLGMGFEQRHLLLEIRKIVAQYQL